MFHDLDVLVPPEAREAALQTLQRLGYDVVAFTTVIDGQKKLSDKDIPRRQEYAALKAKQNVLHPDKAKRRRGMTVLERVTLVIDDPSHLSIFSSPQLAKFDIVAVRPTSEKLFQQCLQFDFDIISLPFERRQLFQLKRPHVHVIVEKFLTSCGFMDERTLQGIYLEIPYSLGLRDSTSRRHLVSNASSMSNVTNGQHFIISSGARNPMEMRAPLDVINLGILFDIPQQHARDAVISNAEAVIAHGDIRAKVHKGIVRIEKVDKQGTDGKDKTKT